MPPLLAALLMIELGCDLRIVAAIDLGQEWRRWQPSVCEGWSSAYCTHWNPYWSDGWYAGWLGRCVKNSKALSMGTFLWPTSGSRRY